MEKKSQAGIATFVMHEKEYLVAILSENGILRAEILRFNDEVRKPSEAGLLHIPKPDHKRVEHVVRQIEKNKATKLKPSLLEDEYARKIQKLIEQKRKHHQDTVEVKSEESEEDAEVDLMAVLKRSLTQKAHAGSKHKSSGTTHGSPARAHGAHKPRRKSA